MDCYGYQEPEWHHENRSGDVFYTCYCEGCGDEMPLNHESNILSYPPMFFKNCSGQCTRQQALTNYADTCQRCGLEKVYLTPGTAMRKKIAEAKGEFYQQRKKYCDDCLNEVIHRVPCRNAGCGSVGGDKFVEATFGEQIWYKKREWLTFPPKKCAVCKRIIKTIESKPEIRPNCQLCKKPFLVTSGLLIMILKNENEFKIPRECVRCRGLSPAERSRIESENSLQEDIKKRVRELARVLTLDAEELEREEARWKAAKKEKNIKLKNKLERAKTLIRNDMRAVLQTALDDRTLLNILSDPKQSGYREIQAALAHVTGGKSAMTEKEFNALPAAFHEILKDYPNAVGIFENKLGYRAPGTPWMSPVQQHYEILSAAAISQKEVKSISGKTLALYPTDSPDWGIKFKPEYEPPNENNLRSGKLTSIEADFLIHRNETIMDSLILRQPEVIGVDAKHTKTDHYPPSTKYHDEVINKLETQLEGIRHHFQHGNLTEFFFVTNKEFDDDFRTAVEKMNLTLVEDYIKEHNENIIPEEYRHPDERDATPAGAVDLSEMGNLKEYNQEVKDFVSKYEIKQIEMCEYVRYTGT